MPYSTTGRKDAGTDAFSLGSHRKKYHNFFVDYWLFKNALLLTVKPKENILGHKHPEMHKQHPFILREVLLP